MITIRHILGRLPCNQENAVTEGFVHFEVGGRKGGVHTCTHCDQTTFKVDQKINQSDGETMLAGRLLCYYVYTVVIFPYIG